MNPNSLLIFGLLLFSLDGIIAEEEKIQPETLRAIFPYVKLWIVKKVAIRLNQQRDLLHQWSILSPWIEENWVKVTKPESEMVREPQKSNGRNKFKFRDLSDKGFARHEAYKFLEHRRYVKLFILQCLLFVQDHNFFSANETEQMRQLYWKVDTECNNYFRCTGPRFFEKTSNTFANSKRNSSSIEQKLMVIGPIFVDPEWAREGLMWKLEGGTENIPKKFESKEMTVRDGKMYWN